MTKTQADQLEAIIDSYGLEMTLHTISDICHDKASHILENWQDSPLAKEWDKKADKIEKLSANLEKATVKRFNH